MILKDENLETWRQTVREILDDQRVARYLEERDKRVREYIKSLPPEERAKLNRGDDLPQKERLYRLAEQLLPTQDQSMKGYAESWFAVSEKHAASGLYRRAAEFFRPEEGLLVDIGCGPGFFLRELPFRSVLGIDINHYCLQAAEHVLAGDGRPIRRFSGSYISFDPDNGFILKPLPVMDELDFRQTNLLLDDAENLKNTIRVLYNQGIKADAVSFLLHGGYTNKSPLNFIDFMRFGDYQEWWKKRREEDAKGLVDGVIRNVGRICRSGGRLLLGMRGSVFDEEKKSVKKDADSIVEELAKEFADFIEIERADVLDIEKENTNGIAVTAKKIGKDGNFEELPEEYRELAKTYHLYLISARVK